MPALGLFNKEHLGMLIYSFYWHSKDNSEPKKANENGNSVKHCSMLPHCFSDSYFVDVSVIHYNIPRAVELHLPWFFNSVCRGIRLNSISLLCKLDNVCVCLAKGLAQSLGVFLCSQSFCLMPCVSVRKSGGEERFCQCAWDDLAWSVLRV